MATIRQPAINVRGWQTSPVTVWAALGVFWLALIAYVWGRWIRSPSFAPVDPGPDPLPDYVRIAINVVQIGGPIGFLLMAYVWIYTPWKRTGAMSVEGMLIIAWSLVYFQDPLMSYTANHLLYNAYLVNYGAWTTGIFPGWTAPNTQYLAEPILVGLTAYPYAGFLPAFCVSLALRRARARWPGMSLWWPLLLALLVLMVIDTAIEGTLVWFQIEAYPGAVRAYSLFPGTPQQFPLSEALLWGLNMMTSTLLLTFRADNGQTIVERGSERYSKQPFKQNAVRLLAVVAFVQMGQLVTWVIPQQWFATHGDPWPEMPSYMNTNVCGKGTEFPCPAPGVPISRAQ